ncbi:MAG: AmmeMemoRadiSam system protein A [Chloroflexota bacterium]
MPESLTLEEKTVLLKIAREAIIKSVKGEAKTKIDLSTLPVQLQEAGASFVTLTKAGHLRGCIGTLEAYQALAWDVQEHAIAAAIKDYRFPSLKPQELDEISIEISHLTQPEVFDYQSADELLQGLRPGIDGVILTDGSQRATFLPQVWKNPPDPVDFLSQLCIKMGSAPNLWHKQLLEVKTYQVEEFHEAQQSSACARN